jgi:hypothetical protein
MTPFNPQNKKTLTFGECLKPAMEITDQADADQYKAAYIAYTQKFLDADPSMNKHTAEEIVNINIGYFAGYYDSKTMSRVYRLFKTAHPVFGNSTPTAEEALSAGIKAAK